MLPVLFHAQQLNEPFLHASRRECGGDGGAGLRCTSPGLYVPSRESYRDWGTASQCDSYSNVVFVFAVVVVPPFIICFVTSPIHVCVSPCAKRDRRKNKI